jgi:hypothetical protein
MAVFVVPALALALGIGAWGVWREATKPQPLAVDTSTCERLLTTASAAAPGKFLVCAGAPRIVYRLQGGQRQALSLAANAVYELPIDGRTRIEGLSAPEMRYGWGGTSCERLTSSSKTVLLDGPPVDRASC